MSIEQTIPISRERVQGLAATPALEARHRLASPISLALVLVGTVLRLQAFLAARPLWLDEAMLALNIQRRSLVQLWRPPLAMSQVAAPGYLTLERLAYLASSHLELALRTPAFIGGITTLLLGAWLARRLLQGWASVATIAIFAVSPSLIFYGTQAKPFALDAALACTTLLIALSRIDAPNSRLRDALWGAIVGVFSWFSIPIGIAAAGILAALRRPAALVGWALAAVPALVYTRRYAAGNPTFAAYWSVGFPGRSFVGWLAHLPQHVIESPLHWNIPVVAPVGILLLAVGCLVAVRSPRHRLLLASLLPAIAAAALHVYPFGGDGAGGGRVILYLLPSLILLAGLGIQRLAAVHWVLGALAGGAVIVAGLGMEAANPYRYAQADTPAALRYIRDHWRQGDRLYVHFVAEPEAKVYGGDWLRTHDVVIGAPHWSEPEACCQEVANLPPGRTWALYSFLAYGPFREWQGREAAAMRRRGVPIDSLIAGNTAVWLYNLGSR